MLSYIEKRCAELRRAEEMLEFLKGALTRECIGDGPWIDTTEQSRARWKEKVALLRKSIVRATDRAAV